MHAEQVMAINVQPLIRLTYWVWIFQGKSEKICFNVFHQKLFKGLSRRTYD